MSQGVSFAAIDNLRWLVDDGSAIDDHAVWRYGWERDNRDNFRCQNEDPPNIAQRCAIL